MDRPGGLLRRRGLGVLGGIGVQVRMGEGRLEKQERGRSAAGRKVKQAEGKRLLKAHVGRLATKQRKGKHQVAAGATTGKGNAMEAS